MVARCREGNASQPRGDSREWQPRPCAIIKASGAGGQSGGAHSVDDDRTETTETLIHRNRALLALAATARADAHEAVAWATDHLAPSDSVSLTWPFEPRMH